MFWLGFISALGVATVVVIWWMEWDKRKQLEELDVQNTKLLLYRVSDLEDKVAAIVAKNILEVELKKGGERG